MITNESSFASSLKILGCWTIYELGKNNGVKHVKVMNAKNVKNVSVMSVNVVNFVNVKSLNLVNVVNVNVVNVNVKSASCNRGGFI